MTVRLSFYLGGGVFLLAVLWTVIRTKEYSPEVLKRFAESSVSEAEQHDDTPDPIRKYFLRGIVWALVVILFALPVFYLKLEKELYILAGGLGLFGLLQLVCAVLISGNRGSNDPVGSLKEAFRQRGAVARSAAAFRKSVRGRPIMMHPISYWCALSRPFQFLTNSFSHRLHRTLPGKPAVSPEPWLLLITGRSFLP